MGSSTSKSKKKNSRDVLMLENKQMMKWMDKIKTKFGDETASQFNNAIFQLGRPNDALNAKDYETEYIKNIKRDLRNPEWDSSNIMNTMSQKVHQFKDETKCESFYQFLRNMIVYEVYSYTKAVGGDHKYIIIPYRIPMKEEDDDNKEFFVYADKLPHSWKEQVSLYKINQQRSHSQFQPKTIYDYFHGDHWIIKQSVNNFIAFNKKALEYDKLQQENEEKSNNSNDGGIHSSDHVIYIGDEDETPCLFPYVIAELNVFDKEIDDFDHDEFKQFMNEWQINNTEIINDFHDYGKGNGKIHKLVNPNKNLASLFVMDTAENDSFGFYFPDGNNYHRWIPTLFKINDKLDKVEMTEIPNLDGYRYKDTLYDKYIPKIFAKMVPMFENILKTQLRNINLKAIVKIQDYIISEQDIFKGGIHKDGLFEDIEAIGIYYYHIDENIIGGDLELHAVIQKDDEYIGRNDKHGTDVRFTTVKLKEGNILVFNNKYCYHRVSEMMIKKDINKKKGNRKIMAFFLINPNNIIYDPSTNIIVTNWKSQMAQFICKWFDIHINDIYNGSYNWLYDTIGQYMIGDKQYIKNQTNMYRKSRKVYSYQRFSKYLTDIQQEGTFNWYREDW